MTRAIPLTAADRAFLRERPRGRPPNQALVLDFGPSADPPFSFEELDRGAASAARAFPAAASRLVFQRRGTPVWDASAGEPFRMVVRTGSRHEDRNRLLRDFVNTDFPLRGQAPVRQLLAGVGNPPAWSLLTQAQQAVSDLPGIVQLLEHQLRVAAGKPPSASEPQHAPPAVRQIRRRKDDDEVVEEERSTRLQVFDRRPSARRRWGTISFPYAPFSRYSWSVDGFSWSDVLLAGVLEALAAWNRGAGASKSRVGLSVQIDVRARSFEGFGNGSSRILVPRPWAEDDMARSFPACCRAVGGVALDKLHGGHWAVPSGLSASLIAAATDRIRGWGGWRGPDQGTASLTLLDRGGRAQGDLLPGGVRGMEIVSALHPRHSISFGVIPWGGQILVTVTWDEAQLTTTEVRTILAHFRRLVRSLAAHGSAGEQRAGSPGS